MTPRGEGEGGGPPPPPPTTNEAQGSRARAALREGLMGAATPPPSHGPRFDGGGAHPLSGTYTIRVGCGGLWVAVVTDADRRNAGRGLAARKRMPTGDNIVGEGVEMVEIFCKHGEVGVNIDLVTCFAPLPFSILFSPPLKLL